MSLSGSPLSFHTSVNRPNTFFVVLHMIHIFNMPSVSVPHDLFKNRGEQQFVSATSGGLLGSYMYALGSLNPTRCGILMLNAYIFELIV